MKASNIASKQIIIELFFTIVILGVIVVVGYLLFDNLKGNDVFSQNDLVVEFKTDDTSDTLLSMSDSSGLKTNPYKFIVTNNGKRNVKYSVYVKPKFSTDIDYEKYLKVSVDDLYVDTFDKLKKGRDGNYSIFTESLSVGATGSHIFKLWLSSDAPQALKGIKSDFEFNVEGE